MTQLPASPLRRLAKLLPAALLLLLLIPAASQAQATRTWVSGVGDDANPCSRTAPCKTFAGSISKTAAGGEINAVDSGAFGSVTITKSITIDGHGHQAGVLAAGTHGITVNAPAGARVVLRELDINGAADTGSPGLNGIRIVGQGRSISIVRSRIYSFGENGILFQPTGGKIRLLVRDSEILNNRGNGLFVSPPNDTTQARVTLRRNSIESNGCGVTAASYGLDSGTYDTNCGAATSGGGAPGRATISAFRNGINENEDAGFFAYGTKATVRMGGNEVSGNGRGMAFGAGGALDSFGNNYVVGNSTDGAPTSTIPRM